ncbi:alpha/beta hydrolase [Novosphingobium mangrovi (ex Huang et al. 2023)]|uniref:Alpha/beta hydrolase n=1 Tax=Novosphingobium mangrovi (ex Huang et al. 2023) TaxID=2976432 RepID=A0ABT2I5B2_9SPHN|nr:alpha/beta hydrolase [Novosphingobium mangrovi (ex Huang et al. 2023)]MCT2399997.1 alpha/beta hydrolase [Novosphingobium mangrovi (ex Huang et al. 2023)]
MSKHPIRPDAQGYLDLMAANPRPPMGDESIAQMRVIPKEVMAQMIGAFDLPVGELGEVRDVVMPGPGGDMELRLFDVRAERGPGPVVVFYHGGGFVVGSIDTHAALAAEISRQLDLPVVSVEYRLAPEHKWPAGIDDGEAAARWIAENGAAFGREFTGLVLCGDSAGGNLTLVTALALRDRPAALPVILQLPIYPKADSSESYESYVLFGEGYGLSREDMAYFDRVYAADPHHWRHSPFVADLSGLPPMVMATAGLDPLRDEGRAFAAKAVEAGVQVVYRECTGTIHGFATYRKAIPSAQTDLDTIMAHARLLLAEAGAGG